MSKNEDFSTLSKIEQSIKIFFHKNHEKRSQITTLKRERKSKKYLNRRLLGNVQFLAKKTNKTEQFLKKLFVFTNPAFFFTFSVLNY